MMKNFGKKIFTVLMIGFLMVPTSAGVYAAPTLREVLEQEAGAEVTYGEEDTDGDNQEGNGDGSYIDRLYDFADYTKPEPAVETIQDKMDRGVGMLFQLLAYLVVAGLVMRILVDLIFLLVPPARGLFIKERPLPQFWPTEEPELPKSKKEMEERETEAFNRGLLAGISPKEYHWVSEESVRAVEQGKEGKSAIAVYFEDTIKISILTGVLLVLALTGILQQIGFVMGELLVHLIRGIL